MRRIRATGWKSSVTENEENWGFSECERKETTNVKSILFLYGNAHTWIEFEWIYSILLKATIACRALQAVIIPALLLLLLFIVIIERG